MASMVVIARAPTDSTGVTHERTGCPSRWTVQAPQSAIPHPNLVPVIPSTSRNTQSSGMSPSTSTVRTAPFTFSLICIDCLSLSVLRAGAAGFGPAPGHSVKFLLADRRRVARPGPPRPLHQRVARQVMDERRDIATPVLVSFDEGFA